MHDMANRRIAKLSTGMKQKVSIVRTIIHDPDIIIFDEPTSGLDVMTSQRIITIINGTDCCNVFGGSWVSAFLWLLLYGGGGS